MSDSTRLAPDLKTRPYWWDAAPPVEAPSGDAPTAVDVAIVGGGCGQMASGRHVVYPENTPFMSVGVTLLAKVGVQVDQISDSKGLLSGI